MSKRTSGSPRVAADLATTTAIDIDIKDVDRVSVQVVYSDADPAASAVAAASVDADEDTFTDAAHGFVTGTKGQMTTSAADLPDGLATTTDYFIIKVDADTYKLASSLANAVAGTAIDLADVGTGTHTFTPVASADNVAKLQESNDNSNWTDVGSYTVTIATTAGAVVWPVGAVSSRYLRVLYTPTSGQVSLAVHAAYVN